VGIEGEHLGSDPDYLDVINLPDLRDQAFQSRGCQDKRVATGDEDVCDLGMVLDVSYPGRIVLRDLVDVIHEEAFPETEPAETSAYVNCEE